MRISYLADFDYGTGSHDLKSVAPLSEIQPYVEIVSGLTFSSIRLQELLPICNWICEWVSK